MSRIWLLWGILLAALAVGMGAFGAHAWKIQLAENQRTEVFETAARYHMYHALALIALGLYRGQLSQRLKLSFLTGNFFLTGTLLFSGSLYALALTNTPWLAAITPIGGVMQLLGWLAWGVEVWLTRPAESR